MKCLTAFYIVLLPLTVAAQYFHLEPERPTVADTLSFQYNPGSVFGYQADISCIVYFTGLEDRGTWRREFPKAREVRLKKQGALWLGQVDDIPHNATALVVTFTDSIGNRDTNQGKGYSTPLYRHDKPIPGAWAGIGELLYGEWITEKCAFHIGLNLDSLRQFLLKDVVEYPDIKRSYMRQYLSTFKLNSRDSIAMFTKELQAFADLADLSQSESLLLKNHYMRLGDTTQANRLERELLERYPQGARAVQVKTIKLLMDIGMSSEFDEKRKLYKEFRDKYFKIYADELATVSINNRAAQILGYMAEDFVREGNLGVWLDEVDKLSPDARSRAYSSAARHLLRLSQRPRQVANSAIERMAFEHDPVEPGLMLETAESLAGRAVSLYKEHIDTATRKFNEPLMFTDEQIMAFRNEKLSDYLAIWGKCLLKEGNLAQAVDALAEAVARNNYGRATINQPYIEVLVRAGKRELAFAEMRKTIANGRSTAAIDSMYAAFEAQNLALLQTTSFENQKRKLKGRLIREKIGDLYYYDRNNLRHALSEHEGKIIVVNFWASWCPPCKESLTVLDKTIDRHKNETDIVFLLINEDADRERAKEWIRLYRNKDSFVFDDNRAAVRKAGVNGLPARLVIDKKGNIRYRSVGMSAEASELEATIEYLR